MTLKTLKYTAHTTKEGYQQLDETLLQFGILYNALITHRRSRSSTHRHVKYLNIQNSHITDLHRNDPTYSGFARRLLVSTAKRVNTAFARPHLVPGAGYPDTKAPHRFNTLEVSEPSTEHLKISGDGKTATLSVKGLPTVSFNTDHRMRQIRPKGRDFNPESVPADGIPRDVQPRTFRITRTPRRLTVTMVFETEHRKLPEPQVDSAGIDPGRKNLITTSDSEGTVTHIPGLDDRPHRKVTRRLKRKAQRQRDSALKEGRARFVTQKTREGRTKRRFRWVGKPSTSYLKNQAKLRRVEQKRSDSRHGLQHRITTELVRNLPAHLHGRYPDTEYDRVGQGDPGGTRDPGETEGRSEPGDSLPGLVRNETQTRIQMRLERENLHSGASPRDQHHLRKLRSFGEGQPPHPGEVPLQKVQLRSKCGRQRRREYPAPGHRSGQGRRLAGQPAMPGNRQVWTHRRTPEGDQAHTGGGGQPSWPNPMDAVRVN